MMGFIRVAWRNYSRNLRRYRVLLAALVMISLVLTVVLATVLGLQASVREKASRYFGGSLVVLGHSGDGTSVIEDPDAVEGAVRGQVTVGLVWTHIVAGLGLALISVVYPLKRALGVSPREAMTA